VRTDRLQSPPAETLSGPLAWTVAWRFLRGRGRRSRLLDGTARAALSATALGVTAMVIAMALMTGYRDDLQSKLIRGNAAVIAYPVGGKTTALDAAKRVGLARVPGVQTIGEVAYGQGSLASRAVPQGVEVVLRGVDPGGRQLGATSADLAPAADGIPRAVLGAELARRLGVRAGDVVRLVALGFEGERPRFRYQSLRVARVFSTGFAEFDRTWMLLARPLVEGLMGSGLSGDLLEFTLADPAGSPEAAERISTILNPDFVVTDWQQLNRELFTALKLQQVALFIVLGLIVLVSTFNVASTLVVLVRERMRDIGVLGALGLSPWRLRSAFLLYGAILGGLGTLTGVAFGAGACWVLTTFHLIRFDPEVAAIYFVDSVPFEVKAADLAAVVGFALLVTLVACWVPAWRAARIDPSTALRYE
jgi:lipoprotein-releasing system permease protein